ncbi:MAG: protease modulator HflC [Stenotrophobium sp.]
MKNSSMLVLALIAGALLTIYNSFFIVDQRERALLFQMGEILGTDYGPGLHFKIPYIQTAQMFDGRLLTLNNQAENFLTAEKKNVEVDYFVKWRIANFSTYYRATAGQKLVAMDRLSSIVNRNLRDQFGSMTVQQAVSGGREDIAGSLKKQAFNNVRDLGIQIVDVRIKGINLPKEVSSSVYDRMRAERTRVAAALRASGAEEGEKLRATADQTATVTIADAYRDGQKIRGEGDAKAADIYAKAYGQDPEFYSFYRSLKAYRDSFDSKQDVLVLDPKSEFFRYFKGAGK